MRVPDFMPYSFPATGGEINLTNARGASFRVWKGDVFLRRIVGVYTAEEQKEDGVVKGDVLTFKHSDA